MQSFLFLVHLFLYETWTFSPEGRVSSALAAKLAFAALSVCFICASLLGFRYSNAIVRALYRISAVWLGFLTFVFSAAAASWIVFALARIAGFHPNFHRMVQIFFGLALAAGVYGLFNASWTRVTRAIVHLPNLPEKWRGRRAALVSDLHLGHVRNRSFLRRIVAKILKEEPDAIFIAGDLFDGMAIDAAKAAEPLKDLAAPGGVYFVAGNHEQFGNDVKYLNAVASTGVRVLNNEKVEVEGLQIIGVPYRNAVQPMRLSSILHSLALDRKEYFADSRSGPSGDR
jgi:hypothetical protein